MIVTEDRVLKKQAEAIDHMLRRFQEYESGLISIGQWARTRRSLEDAQAAYTALLMLQAGRQKAKGLERK